MLPAVKIAPTFTRLRSGAIAAAAALSMVAATVSPAHALDDDEKNFLKGVAAAVIVGTIANNITKNNQRRYQEPRYVTQQPRYYAPQTRYQEPRYQEPRYYAPEHTYTQPRYQPQYGGAVSTAFRDYTPASRRAIQSRLRAYGYYSGSIDGAYGPATRAAIEAYARDTGNDALLDSRNGTVTLLNGLLA